MAVDHPKAVAAIPTLSGRQNKHHHDDRHCHCRAESTNTPNYLQQQQHHHQRHHDPRRNPLNIAILLNSCRSRFLPAIRASYVRTIGAVDPDAHLTFFEPANRPGDFPADPTSYDLIVLGGGNVDPRASHPWILEIHDFIRQLVQLQQRQAAQPPRSSNGGDHSRLRHTHRRRVPKLLGICWGHQTIARVFGGEVVDSPSPEMGVGTVSLTPEGRDFFFSSHPPLKNQYHNSCTKISARPATFDLQQHHRREVARPAVGFEVLAEENQVLALRHRRHNQHHHQHQYSLSSGSDKKQAVNHKARSSAAASPDILTFQGHPEKDAETARLRLHDAVRWFGLREETKKAKKEQKKLTRSGCVGDHPMGEKVGDEGYQGGQKKEEEDKEDDEEEDEAAAKQRSEAWGRLRNMMDLPHDGEMVWRRILDWVRESDDDDDNGGEEDNVYDEKNDDQATVSVSELDARHHCCDEITIGEKAMPVMAGPRSLKI